MSKTYILEPTNLLFMQRTTSPGTYTVSIYTGEDDPASTNNFDFSDHPRNDIEGIDDLLDDILGLKESEKEETSANKPDIGGEPK